MGTAIISGRAYPLGLDNVDTDMIIAADHLKTLSRRGLGAHAFGALRQLSGNLFDDTRYRNASILIAGQNFGCGSSREHAVWALMDLGIRAVIGGSFSDIFAGNALKNGLVAISLGSAGLELVLAHSRTAELTIDLDQQFIELGATRLSFAMEAGQRAQLLSGGDEIGMTLSFENVIAQYEEKLCRWHAPHVQEV